MKSKTLIKILTVTLFVSLISGFTLYKSGYLFAEKKASYIPDPNGGTEVELKNQRTEDFGLNTFQLLKMKGVFDPGSFDTLYSAPVFFSSDPHHFLSNSKSMLVSDRIYFKQSISSYDSFLSILLSQQFDTLKPVQRK